MGIGIIKYIADSLLSIIYDREDKCLICDIYCLNEDMICNSCLRKVNFSYNNFKIRKDNLELECFSAAYYSGIVKELIRRFKYKSDFYAGEALGNFLVKLIKIKSIDFDLVTFIPMSKKAYKARGFNQSRYLAKLISQSFGVPLKELLIKVRETRDQIDLDGTSRWENLQGSFKVYNASFIKNKKILLVDDVVTTGATSFYCFEELKKNNALTVTVLTVAKSKL